LPDTGGLEGVTGFVVTPAKAGGSVHAGFGLAAARVPALVGMTTKCRALGSPADLSVAE
jgi:hypothetical protein